MTVWRKSSHSGTNAGSECVEVALLWRKSSRSGGSQDDTACVEVAPLGGQVAVRDSRDPAGARLYLEPAEWTALLTRIKIAADPQGISGL